MSDEITVNLTLKYDNLGIILQRQVQNVKSDQASRKMSYQIQTITAAKVALIMGEVSTAGMSFFRNLQPLGGNTVEIGREIAGVFQSFMVLNPQEANIVRLATNSPFAQTLVGNVDLEYQILGD